MEQIRVHLDYETFSEADIKKVGHIAYAKHPSTRVLMAAWGIRNEPVRQWHYLQGPPPDELLDILENYEGEYVVWAHNASFEIAITRYAARRQFGLTLPSWQKWLRNWRCSMVQGMAMSLPGTLKEQGTILGSQVLKQTEGMRLIRTFCVPRKPTKNNPSTITRPEDKPADWEMFLSYNRDDVDAERANWRRTAGFAMPAHEWELWHIDQEINFRGLAIDTELVDAALAVNEMVQEILKKEMKRTTKLANPNSTTQLLPWLQERGYPHDDLRKANVEKSLKQYVDFAAEVDGAQEPPFDAEVARVLDLRLLTSRTSIKKYDALKNSTTLEPRMYGVFQFAGAGRTWRWAGRRFQPQNLPRGIFKTEQEMSIAIHAVKTLNLQYLDAMYDMENIPDVLASLIRNCVTASPGKVLTVADLSSIESVMLAWAANSEYMLDLFRQGLDIYKDFATHWLKVPYNEVTKAMRQLCKPPSLGCFAAETQVLTLRGWVYIVNVTADDWLWDGEQWVQHDGVVFQGHKTTVNAHGVRATPDHLILTSVGWIPWDDALHNIHLATGGEVVNEYGVRHTYSTEVYDVLNAGPRNRFTVLTDQGPIIVHNCGYLLGAKGLMAYADAMGVKLTKEEAKAAVKTYRTAYPDVPQFWNDLDEAARLCISTGQSVTVNGKFRFRMQKPCMMIDLPSGRSLCYVRPKLEERLFRFEDIDTGEIKERWQVSICYEGRNQTTGRWERIATHAGKITENIVQAIARDILAEGMRNVHCEMPDADMVLHVHDELGAETPNEPVYLERLQELMTRPPAWGLDIPLGSAGFQNSFYLKD